MKRLMDSKIHAIDGEIGKADDFYFDDRSWGIRYMIVNTGDWLTAKKVLLSPVVINNTDMENNQIYTKLTKNQIVDSPDIDTNRPVSQQDDHDEDIWPLYGMVPAGYPILENKNKRKERNQGDPHLRSAEEVIGYNISALDGDIGHVEDMIVEDVDWAIHFWVVKTKNWLPGKKVLISPHWVNLISWEDEKVYVDMTVDSIKSSPEYDPSQPLHMEYEGELNNYYGRKRFNGQ
jgi:uncharacterized protein YrrD